MRNFKFLLFIAVLTAIFTLSACQTQPTAQATPEALAPLGVLAQGQVEPADYVDVAFTAPGRVEAVLVADGESVQAGQVMARLSGGEARTTELARAQQELLAAEQALQDLQDTPALSQALAEAAVVEAEVALQAKRDVLAELQKGINQLLVAQAEARLALAQAQLDEAREEAQVLEDQANPDALELAQAQSKRADAEKDFQDAQDSLDDLKQGVDPLLVSQAEAQLSLAEAQLDKARQDAQSLQDGIDPQRLDAARSRLETAQAGVASAQAAVEALELRAPIGGTVTGLSLKVGQFVPAGQSVLAVADLTRWMIQTEDLTELEVVSVEPGQLVSVQLDALPQEPLSGTVMHIAQRSVDNRGDVTYTVTIKLDAVPAELRWGMTGQVSFSQDE